MRLNWSRYDLMTAHPTLTSCEGFVLFEKVALPAEHAWYIDEDLVINDWDVLVPASEPVEVLS